MTTDTYSFVSVILNFEFVGLLTAITAGSAPGSASLFVLLVNTQFSDQVKIRFISQLINSLVFSKNSFNILMARQLQLLFPYCYLLIFM